jgi:hypothetical protein
VSPRRLVGLYPGPWRRRYADEFLALLEDRPPGALQVMDIVLGAVDAHLFPQAPEGRFRMFTRLSGVAALGAGLILTVGIFWTVGAEVNAYRVNAFYVLGLVGLVGVLLRQVSVRPGLAWFGFAAGLIGFASGITTFALSAAGVLPPSGGEFGYLSGVALWTGSTALGATMLAVGIFPLSACLAITVGAPLAMIGLLAGNVETTADILRIVTRGGIVLYGVGWVGVGLGLLIAQPREGVLGQPA